ncbi:MAG: S46 family peptidase [Bacteroidales bacterium]|nr:S46 family peptidase [Bacteroidales bacterium]
MRKSLLIILLLVAFRLDAGPVEGMWIPFLLEQMNIKQMRDMGLRLSAEDIYSVNHSCLKDAIVQFGGGCTAEIVSPQGLILTNYHCGLGSIQRHSSLQHDYLNDGFWAASFDDELPCPGLSVTLLVRIEDVTERALHGIGEEMNQIQRQQLIKQNIEAIEKEAIRGNHFEARVRPFFYGNQYYLFVNETYKDIRLVGAPPSGIGKFGGDTDNWMWPRHTGDFSVFRIYANQNNEPAPYSRQNLPYKPKYYLPISLQGYEKGDFTFVFGYPGNTREYLPSYGIDLAADQENPLRILLRGKRLDIMKEAMDQSRLVRIQYAAKANAISNGWKKMIGESRGVRRIDAIGKKKAYEEKFRLWADSTPEHQKKYGSLLSSFEKIYLEYLPVDLASVYISEAGQGIELVRFAAGFMELARLSQAKTLNPDTLTLLLTDLKRYTRGFYRNYQPGIDEKVMSQMLHEMASSMNVGYRPAILSEIGKSHGNNWDEYARKLFQRSILSDSTRLIAFLDGYRPTNYRKLEKDPAYQLMLGIYEMNEKNIIPKIKQFTGLLDSLQRIYMAGQMEMEKNRTFYPDANFSMRIAYGKVDDCQPMDAVTYHYFTTLDGVMQKEDSTVYDYRVNSRLKTLFQKRDYGAYVDRDGTMHVAFLASNHTTGGNSGSPVLNSVGALIGINFDRNWEGTQSDLMYDPLQCRNISLDIRYCLFIIDKYAGAGRLIREMKIIDAAQSL